MRLIIITIFIGLNTLAIGQTARQLVREGNESYIIDSLQTAISTYESAIELDPQLESAKFNLGDAFYRSEKYADASTTFHELGASTKNTALKSDAFYNEGNALMQTQKFEDAMNAYKSSMRANPNNNSARYNYEFAKKMLKEQQKQEQENKDDKDDKDQDKDDKDKDDKDKGDKKDQDKNKDDKDSDKDKDEDKKNKDDEKKDGDKDKDDEKKDQDGEKDEDKKDPENPEDQENQQPQPGQMSKADAERLLKAMEDNEKKTRERIAKLKAKSQTKKKSDKDW